MFSREEKANLCVERLENLGINACSDEGDVTVTLKSVDKNNEENIVSISLSDDEINRRAEERILIDLIDKHGIYKLVEQIYYLYDLPNPLNILKQLIEDLDRPF